jgi:sugar phosphate isomerase/epimerase
MKGVGVLPVLEPDLNAEQKYRLIKKVGFDAVNIYWGDADKHEQVEAAKRVGLVIDNIHSQNDNANAIWVEENEGEERKAALLSCINDCALYGVSCVVIHLTGFPPYPPVTELGLQRIESLVKAAEQKNVKLAFENLWTFEHLDAAFEHFANPHVGFCFDCGHENLNRYKDCLASYGDKLFALHINDNFADGYDAHVLPFEGTIDWSSKMRQIRQHRDIEFLTLEIYKLESGEHDKSCLYKNMTAAEFLKATYEKAITLLGM